MNRDGKSLIWVGPTEHPEIAIHWHFVRLRCEVHLRNDLEELARYPVPECEEVAVVRLDRRPLPDTLLESAMQKHLAARWRVLEGSSVFGAACSGKLWPKIKRIPWHAPVSIWSEACASISDKSVAVLGGHRSNVTWIAERFSANGIPVVALSVDAYRSLYHFPTWIWDDSAIDQLGEKLWLDRIQQLCTSDSSIQHLALTSLPHAKSRQRWLDAGVAHVYAKPLFDNALFSRFSD